MYVTEAEEEIYHATDATTYIKPKTIVCQNNRSEERRVGKECVP